MQPRMPRRSPASATALLLALAARLGEARPASEFTMAADTCPGKIVVGGYGTAELVATENNVKDDPAGKVYVQDGKVVPHYRSRGYFADACTVGKYNHSDYLALPLLGKALTFTTDLSGTGCGCNVAMYLTQLQQNDQISDCEDYYCDANSVCGVMCHEIDIMEANANAFRCSLHTEDDAWGASTGLGGEAYHWSTEEYGPKGKCINTGSPFQVTAEFPTDGNGVLEAMTIRLSQVGRPCNLSVSMKDYDGNVSMPGNEAGSHHGMQALGQALREGMTPIVSLWGADDMLWLDGQGAKGMGPCKKDSEDNCPEQVEMYDFYVEKLPPPLPSGFPYMWLLCLVGVVVLIGVVLCVTKSFLPEEDESHEELRSEDST